MNVTSFVNQFAQSSESGERVSAEVKPKTQGTEMGYALTASWPKEMKKKRLRCIRMIRRK